MTMAAGETPGSQAFDQVRVLADDAERLAADARAARHQVEDFLTQQMRTRPYRTLLVAVGAGYVLGGGLASRLTRQLVRMAIRTAAPSLLSLLVRDSAPAANPAANDEHLAT
jgi:hypothetical protein